MIHEVIVVPDASRPRGGQLIPAMRRVTYASVLTAGPCILQPILGAEVLCLKSQEHLVYEIIVVNRRGSVVSQEWYLQDRYEEEKEENKEDDPQIGKMRVVLPASESIGLSESLHRAALASGTPEMSVQMVMLRWERVPGDPLDTDTPAGHIVLETRRRKGMASSIPPLSNFLDKL